MKWLIWKLKLLCPKAPRNKDTQEPQNYQRNAHLLRNILFVLLLLTPFPVMMQAYTKQGLVNALHWDTFLLAMVQLVLNAIFFTSSSFFKTHENKFGKLYFKLLSRMRFS
jgi:heme/copper-type cytochrome/quinol oxidase subunit 4